MAEGGQRVFLMRHGARHDAVYPAWKKTAERPYDTPLSHRGQAETPKLIFQRLSGKTGTHAYKVLGLTGLHTCNMLCEWLVPGNDMNDTPQIPATQDATETTFLSIDSKPFPNFPESRVECHARYRAALDSLADRFWPQQLLLVTHQACVQEAVCWGGKDDDVEADYCAHVQLMRTSKHSHDWQWVEDSGVYRYDPII